MGPATQVVVGPSYSPTVKEPLMFSAPPVTYTVQPGDTMSQIAATHGIPLPELEMWNPLPDENLIYAGQEIRLSGTVSPSSIAGAYHTQQPATQPEPQQPSQTSQGTTSIPAWATCIVQRESGGNPGAVNSIPGYIGNGGGLFGDLQSTWNNYDGYAQPFDAPVSVQIAFNNQLRAQDGLSPWAADGCPGT